MRTKRINFGMWTVIFIGALLLIFTCSCGDYGVDPTPSTPSVPEPPVVFGNTTEANFFFSFEEYDVPSISWYTYFSKDGKNWSLLTPSNFDGVASDYWDENPVNVDFFYDKTIKKQYLYYPVPTNSITIKTFVIFDSKKIDENIFIAVKTLPEDKSDTIFGSSFTRELIPVELKDSLKIGKIDSMITKYGNQRIQISYTVEKFDAVKTALNTYDSKNGLKFALVGGPVLDSIIFQVNDRKISFSKSLSEDKEGNMYLHSAYGSNAKLVNVKTVK